MVLTWVFQWNFPLSETNQLGQLIWGNWMFCSSFFFSLQEGMSGKTKLWSRLVLYKNAEKLLSKLLSLHFPHVFPFLFCANITVPTIFFSSKVPSLKYYPSISSLDNLDLMQQSFLVFLPFLLEQLSLPALFLTFNIFILFPFNLSLYYGF